MTKTEKTKKNINNWVGVTNLAVIYLIVVTACKLIKLVLENDERTCFYLKTPILIKSDKAGDTFIKNVTFLAYLCYFMIYVKYFSLY